MPYVTMVRDGVTPSAIPAINNVHHNFVVNNYGADGEHSLVNSGAFVAHSPTSHCPPLLPPLSLPSYPPPPPLLVSGGCWDTDDGSSWYLFNSNACIWSGHKSDFFGHSKTSINNLHLYSSVYGHRCMDIGAQVLPMAGYPDVYINNTCVLLPGSQCIDLGQSANGFPDASVFTTQVTLANNTIYVPEGSACPAAGTKFKTYADLQAAGYEAPGLPPTNFPSSMPTAEEMVGWIEALLAAPGVRLGRDAAA